MRRLMGSLTVLAMFAFVLAGCEKDAGCPPQAGRVTVAFEDGVRASRATALLDSLELAFHPSLHDAFSIIARAEEPDTVSAEVLDRLFTELEARFDSTAQFVTAMYHDSLGAYAHVFCHDLDPDSVRAVIAAVPPLTYSGCAWEPKVTIAEVRVGSEMAYVNTLQAHELVAWAEHTVLCY